MTSSTRSAASSPFMAIARPRISLISDSMRYSIAARRAPASRPAIIARSAARNRWGMSPISSLPSKSRACRANMAIGHTRYSTAGDTVLLNAQPFVVACNKGQIAVAHNGNITNAGELKRDLEREGSIFQASSDTEVVLHLVARSRERTLADALREALAATGRRVFVGVSGEGPRDCRARSARFPPARVRTNAVARRRHGVCICFGNLRFRSHQCGIRR